MNAQTIESKTEPAQPATVRPFAPVRVGSDGAVHATRQLVNGRPLAGASTLCRITTGRGTLNVALQPAGTPVTCTKCLTVIGASALIVSVSAEPDDRTATGALVARDRGEREPCEAGTVGCCVKHVGEDAGCESW